MNAHLLDLYTDYLIVQNQYATATGLATLLDGQISHDKITRFLNGDEQGSKELWHYIKREVRRLEQPSGGVLILDDTIDEKPYTDESELICWHYSHAKGRCVKGVNLLSCLVRYGDVALPISFEPIRKDIHFCSLITRREKRTSSTTKNDLFRNLIQQAISNSVKFDYVLADNWFGAKKNMEFIHYDLKKLFIFGIKANRLVALSLEERKKGQYQKVHDLNFKEGEQRKVWLKDFSFPVALTKKLFKNEDGSTGVLYLVTNDVVNDADHIYTIYQKRWKIEEYHKSIKQNASLSKSPTKVIRSQMNHIFASLVAYCKLEFIKCKTSLNHFALKYKLLLKANLGSFLELQNLRSQFCCA